MIAGFRTLVASSLIFVATALAANSAAAEQWYFYVENGTDSKMVKLLAAEAGEKWGHFDIGGGVAPGKKVKIVWDSSTDDESCKQSLKAVFADGTESESEVFDFCENLDDPIVFE
jgi:hypothetical protein